MSKAVGVIGLGIMGSAMCANLVKAGFTVQGYDVLPARRDDLKRAGGSPVSSLTGVDAPVVITSLPSAEALHAVAREMTAKCIVVETSTVDYIIVLKGEIYAVMETGEKLLRAGDILVQRGTNHSWSVRGNEPCIVAAVLVSAKPLSGGSRNKTKKPAKKAGKKKK